MVEQRHSRRVSGEGSIYSRADGKWVGTVELGWKEGKRARKVVYGSTKREVLSKLKTARQQLEQGIQPTHDRLTVATFLNDWLKAVEMTVRPSTFERYRQVVNVHLVPGLGKHRLSQLSPQQVETFLAGRLKTPKPRQLIVPGSPPKILTPRTVKEIRTILVVALNKALRQGIVGRNVAALVAGPRVPHHEIKPLTAEQSFTFLGAVRGHRMEALYTVALTTGLRQGELLALTWDDLDLEGGLLHVRRALQQVKREYRLVETKTAHSRRSLALTTMAIQALRDHRLRQIEERLAAGSAWDGQWNLVFTSTKGLPLHGSTVTVEFQRLLEQNGLPRQRFHDLRHGCASLLLAQGVELKVIQELLGHSAISVTANTYSHVMGDLKKDAAQRMDAVFVGLGRKPA
ncbi:MAG: site-specific integrase [Chloroflexi bacterium]|nr:site-specific integrase [Chloroflexota bacterium]